MGQMECSTPMAAFPCIQRKRKRKQTNNDESTTTTTTTTTSINDLPRDILINILAKLPCNTTLFQSVSKQWHHIISHPHYPHLNFQNSYSTKNQFLTYNPNTYDAFSMEYIPNRDEIVTNMAFSLAQNLNKKKEFLKVVNSCNGWLLIHVKTTPPRYNDSFRLVNPVTRHCMTLPGYYKKNQPWCGFGFGPKSGQYKVVRFLYHPNDRNYHLDVLTVDDQSITGGTATWRRAHKSRQYRDLSKKLYFFGDPVTWNGGLYWVVNKDRSLVLRFDVDREELEWVPLPSEFDSSNMRVDGIGVVQVGSSSLSIYISAYNVKRTTKVEIWVMREKGWSWTRLSVLLFDMCPFDMTPFEVMRVIEGKNGSKIVVVLCTGDVVRLVRCCDRQRVTMWDERAVAVPGMGWDKIRKEFRAVSFTPSFLSLNENGGPITH